jgi:phage terminase large subunit-like protein
MALIVTPPKRRETAGARVVKFIETHCVHPDGEWIGKPIRLEPWEVDLFYRLFELREDGTRRYRWALVGIPKKNGKTTLAAALGLYFLIADPEPSPLIPASAASEEQADLVFGSAKRMCEFSPSLREMTERWDREITVPSRPGARLIRVAAAAGTNDGKNISTNILDELHEWDNRKGRGVWTVLTNGTGARRQPLNFQITTAGHDLETICGEEYEYGCRVASGETDDPRYFMYWRSADLGLDYRSEDYWRSANPNYGVSVERDYFEDQCAKKPEGTVRRYNGNEWTAAEDYWLEHGAWEACLAPELDLDPSLPLVVGIDISNKRDATAAVCAQLLPNNRVVLRARIWANPYHPRDAGYATWVVNNEWVMDHCRQLRERFPAAAAVVDDEPQRGPAFVFDPWNFMESAGKLANEGLTMIDMPQSDARMIPASQKLFELVTAGRAAHDGDAGFTRHIRAARADMKARGWRLTKPKNSRTHIDAAVAAAMAVYQLLGQEPEDEAEESVYNEQDLLVL